MFMTTVTMVREEYKDSINTLNHAGLLKNILSLKYGLKHLRNVLSPVFCLEEMRAFIAADSFLSHSVL